MKGRWFRWGVALGSALALAAAGSGVASAQTGTGDVTGQVTDRQGGALPGVTLVLRSTDSGRFRQSVSGENGAFQFPGMPPGNYEIEAGLQGFRRYQTTVTLINEAQNTEVSPAVTDGRGGFVVPNVSAAVYTGMVERPSFRTLRREGVAVSPASPITH